MQTNILDQLQLHYREMLDKYPDGLSSTSTRKFDPIKKYFSNWLGIDFNDIYATGAGTRPGNLEVRLSQGLQAIKHSRLGLAFLLDVTNTEKNRNKLTTSTLVTIKKFLGGGKSHYDAILIMVQSRDVIFPTCLAYRISEPFVETIIDNLDIAAVIFKDEPESTNLFYPIEDSTVDDSAVEIENVDPEVELMITPFNPALINIESKILTIDLFIKRLSQEIPEIDLYPDFQRKDDLWDETKQSRLIESILIRFPLPAFYFDGSNKNKWLVVDGLQRLSSLRNFTIKKTLRLSNLEFLVKLNGLRYDELDRDLQRIIEETQVVAYIINPGTPDDVKFNIFRRINTGGLILEPQEIRHALFQGEPAKFIAELANTEEFKRATSFSIKSARMVDRDFVNRFLSFYLFGYENYTPDLDSFMSRAMSQVYKMSIEQKEECKSDFIKAMNLSYGIFAENAFRKLDGPRKKPINKALFDVFSVIFSRLSNDDAKILISLKEEVVKGLTELFINDEHYVSAISTSTSDKNRVFYRFRKTEDLLFKFIHNHR